MKDNTMVYFILALMCILIGIQLDQLTYNESSGLIGLGVIILLVLIIKFVRSIIAYANENDKGNKSEEDNQTL